jgi:hypothetical protein
MATGQLVLWCTHSLCENEPFCMPPIEKHLKGDPELMKGLSADFTAHKEQSDLHRVELPCPVVGS